jgi:hypothetical protein
MEALPGPIVGATIIEVATNWFKQSNEDARTSYAKAWQEYVEAGRPEGKAPKKARKLKWNILATLKAVLSFMDYATGECIATYEMIKIAAQCCRDTVYQHLNILRGLGLIDWVRRCEPTGNTEGQMTKAAPNAYFFEISRLPLKAQNWMRQILERRGVKLEAHPDRQGSGPVPNRAQRLAGRIAKSLSSLTGGRRNEEARTSQLQAEAAFVRDEMLWFGDIPTHQWAEIRHPGDLVAQEAYNARMGFLSFTPESLEMPLHSPHENLKDKDRGR